MNVALVICPQADPDKPPLSLAYLGAYLTTKDIKVSCFDFNIDLYYKSSIENKNLWNSQYQAIWSNKHRLESMKLIDESLFQNWLESIESTSPELIGFTLLSTNVYSTLKLAEKIKDNNSNRRIIFGGPEVYRMHGVGRSKILFEYADAIIIGEGEKNLYKIATSINNNVKIEPGNGIIVKKSDILLGDENADMFVDINEIPFPKYDWFSFYKYKEKGQLPLIFSRGCTGRCAFCFERMYWKKFRCRAVSNVTEEIKELQRRHGISCFALNDSLLNGDMQFLSEFCNIIIAEDMKVNWWGMARIDRRMTQDFLCKMVKAGCRQIAYGIESGSQKILNLMRKGYTVRTIEEVLVNTYKAGIKPGINIIIGFPGEEDGDFRDTCEFVKKVGEYISYVNISTLGIEPFTDVYVNKVKMGIDFRDSIDWQTYDMRNDYRVRTERAMILSEIVDSNTDKRHLLLND